MVEFDDDKQFDAAVRRALKVFRAKVRAQAARRREKVLARLYEEMVRLRPHRSRLLYGVTDPPEGKG